MIRTPLLAEREAAVENPGPQPPYILPVGPDRIRLFPGGPLVRARRFQYHHAMPGPVRIRQPPAAPDAADGAVDEEHALPARIVRNPPYILPGSPSDSDAPDVYDN
eukprot:jgi/Mesvir1/15094/Mv14734-RA.1